VWFKCRMELEGLQCGVPFVWTWRSSLPVTGRMEHEGSHCRFTVKWNIYFYNLRYVSIGTLRSTVWVNCRMEREVLQCGVPFEWKSEYISVLYRWN